MPELRGIRGATTIEENAREAILQATAQLMSEIIEKNHLKVAQVACIWLTMTHDLNAAFPAEAVRQLKGWERVPLMCAQEIPVPGSLSRCIRVMALVNTSLHPDEIQHVYQNRAVGLRPDLHQGYQPLKTTT